MEFIYPTEQNSKLLEEYIVDGRACNYKIKIFEIKPVAYNMLIDKRSRFYVTVNDTFELSAQRFMEIGRDWEGFTRTKKETQEVGKAAANLIERHKHLCAMGKTALLEKIRIEGMFTAPRKRAEELFMRVWGISL